jgi:hypothetical protein
MKFTGLLTLAGTLLPLSSASFAGDIEMYKAKEIEVHKAKEINVHQGKAIQPHAGKTITPQAAKTVKQRNTNEIESYKAQQVQLSKGASQARLFAKDDFDEMHRNDVRAGRTRESLSKSDGAKSAEGQNPNPYNDPYNSGGWNYNTNQPASPIWSPNRQ